MRYNGLLLTCSISIFRFTGMVAGKVGKTLAAAMGGTILLVNVTL